MTKPAASRVNDPRPRVREIRDEDLPPLRRLVRATSLHSYARFLGRDAVQAFLDSGEAERYLDEHRATGWLIEEDGPPLGLALAEGALLGQLMIDHRHHRRGLGARLLAVVEAELFARHRTLELHSFVANDAANAFYRARGWGEAARRPDPESGIPMIVFRKRRPSVP